MINLDWRMPFPALWRVDWSTVDKLTDSWEMLLQHPDGRVRDAGLVRPGRVRRAAFRPGVRSRGTGTSPAAAAGIRSWAASLFPCWVDNDRSALPAAAQSSGVMPNAARCTISPARP